MSDDSTTGPFEPPLFFLMRPPGPAPDEPFRLDLAIIARTSVGEEVLPLFRYPHAIAEYLKVSPPEGLAVFEIVKVERASETEKLADLMERLAEVGVIGIIIDPGANGRQAQIHEVIHALRESARAARDRKPPSS